MNNTHFSAHSSNRFISAMMCSRRDERDFDLKTAAKILLAPIQLLTTMLRIARMLVAVFWIYELMNSGWPLLAIPFIAVLIESQSEKAADIIKEFI